MGKPDKELDTKMLAALRDGGLALVNHVLNYWKEKCLQNPSSEQVLNTHLVQGRRGMELLCCITRCS
jgi:hypothetical protein